LGIYDYYLYTWTISVGVFKGIVLFMTQVFLVKGVQIGDVLLYKIALRLYLPRFTVKWLHSKTFV